MFDSYSSQNEPVNEDFRKIADTYFNNYILDWCNKNSIDDAARDHIRRVLSDYSLFFFDSIMHDLIDLDPGIDEIKN